MGFPWRNWTILPFLSLPFEIFFVGFIIHIYTQCLLWHVIHDNNYIFLCSHILLPT